MKRIGLDIDGTIYPWQEVTYKYLSEHNQVHSSYEDFWNKEIHEKTKIFLDNIINDPILIDLVSIHYDTVRFLNELARDNEVYYISSRPNTSIMVRCTERFFRRNRINYTGLYLGADKPYLARSLCLDLFAEDRTHHAMELKGICDVYLVSQPWNRDVNDPTITRINHIMELRNYVG